jgi:hypothetical protein
MAHRLSFAFSLSLLSVLFATAVQAEKRIGIFVGANIGDRYEEPLRYAVADAQRIQRTFVAYGDIKNEDAVILTQPTREELLLSLRTVRRHVRRLKDRNERVVLVFYFTGHGDNAYLHLGNESISRKTLMKEIALIPANMIINVIDACQIENTRKKGVRIKPKFDISTARLDTHEGMVTIQSTMAGTPAYESDTLGSALFTHHFVSALRGAADINRDKRITLLEAYSYAYRETIQYSAQSNQIIQQPHFDMSFKGAGDFVLTNLQHAKSTLTINSDADARYILISQPSGTPIAEVFIEKHKSTSLAIAYGTVLIHKRTAHGAFATETFVPWKGAVNIAADDFKKVNLVHQTQKGGESFYSHRLLAGYTFSFEKFVSGWRPVHGPLLTYQFVFHQFVLSVSSDLIFSAFETTEKSSNETTISVYLLSGVRVPVKHSVFLFSLGPGMQFFYQHCQYFNLERYQNAGIELNNSTVNRFFAPGGRVIAGWQLLFRKGAGIFASTHLTAAFFKDASVQAGDSLFRWQFGVSGGLFIKF